MHKDHNHISLGRFSSKEMISKIKETLHGATYMNIQISVCPAGGEMEIWASSDYDCTLEDFNGMVMSELVWAVASK